MVAKQKILIVDDDEKYRRADLLISDKRVL